MYLLGTPGSHLSGTFKIFRHNFPIQFPEPGNRLFIQKDPVWFLHHVPYPFHIKYTMNFPRGFFLMFRTGSFTVFPRCDQSVTGTLIMVPGLGTLWCHSGCTRRINPQCATSAHQGFFQDAPRCKPDGCSTSVSFRIIPSVTSRFTSRTHFVSFRMS